MGREEWQEGGEDDSDDEEGEDSSEEEGTGEDDSEEDSEDEGEGWDYGFYNADDEDDGEFEIDENANYSPELLAMLGIDCDVIAERHNAIVEQVGDDWRPPEEAGLSNSEAIVKPVEGSEQDIHAVEAAAVVKKEEGEIGVELVKGGERGIGAEPAAEANPIKSDEQGTQVERVAEAAKEEEMHLRVKPVKEGHDQGIQAERAAEGGARSGQGDKLPASTAPEVPVLTLRIPSHVGMETVPKKAEKHLPPLAQASDSENSESGSDSDGSWDEISVADGRAWYEVDSDDECEDYSHFSPNILRLLGKHEAAAEATQRIATSGDLGIGAWIPPLCSGLDNSKRIIPLDAVKLKEPACRTTQAKRAPGEGDSTGHTDAESDDWDSNDGEFDYVEMSDEQYIQGWTTAVSPNLSRLLGGTPAAPQQSGEKLKRTSWMPPAKPGLANSAPLASAQWGGCADCLPTP